MSAPKDGNTAILPNKVFEKPHKSGIETELIQLEGKTINRVKPVGLAEAKGRVQRKDVF